MAIPTGGSQGFNATDFEAGIKLAMQMGAPPEEADRVTFYFPKTLTATGPVDGRGIPFSPAQAITATGPAPIKVDCAVEYLDVTGQPTNFGIVAPARIAVTLLDGEYQQIKGCEYIVAHGDRYNFQRTEPPVGLFDVAVWTLHFLGENET